MPLSRVSVSASVRQGWAMLSRLALVVVPLLLAACATNVPLPQARESLFDDARLPPIRSIRTTRSE